MTGDVQVMIPWSPRNANMSGRMSLGSLFVLALLVPGICWAQGGYGHGPAGGMAAPPAYGQWPPQYVSPAMPGAGLPRTTYEELPDDRGWLFDDSPVGDFLEERLRRAFFRTEYILWSVSGPGDTLLGEVPLAGNNPRLPFPAPDPVTGAIVGTATAPSLGEININNNNGFRGTFGAPVGPGAFEASAFILATSDAELNLTGRITPGDLVGPPIVLPTFVGQPTLVEGARSDTGLLLYTDSYEAVLRTSVWGTEANYIFNAPNANSGNPVTFSPLVGARYLNFRESLRQAGVYDFTNDGGVTFTPVERQINSSTINNSYGPQFGVRAEMNISRLTIGAEPKVMLGLNSYKATLSTRNILSPTEAPLNVSETKTTFGPVADLKVYTRFALSENVHAFASYNFMWAGLITRPDNNIVYNTSITGVGDFRQNVNYTDAIIQGLSVGAEFRY